MQEERLKPGRRGVLERLGGWIGWVEDADAAVRFALVIVLLAAGLLPLLAAAAAIETCSNLGSGAARRHARVRCPASLGRRAAGWLEGPERLVATQYVLALVSIAHRLGYLGSALSPIAGEVLVAAGAAVLLTPAMCTSCRARPYTAAVLTAWGATLLSTSSGAVVGACLLLAAMPYEATRLSVERPSESLGMEPAERRRFVVSALLWVAVLPTLPALDPRLIVVVWLGLSAYIVVGSRRHLLSDHWLTLIARVGRLWPYSHFAARGL